MIQNAVFCLQGKWCLIFFSDNENALKITNADTKCNVLSIKKVVFNIF